MEKQLYADDPEAQDKAKPKKDPTLMEVLMEQRGFEAA